jgi:hypothetical protein
MGPDIWKIKLKVAAIAILHLPILLAMIQSALILFDIVLVLVQFRITQIVIWYDGFFVLLSHNQLLLP